MARVSHLDKSRASLIRIFSWLLAIPFGALQAWSARYLISTEDGISYLDCKRMSFGFCTGEISTLKNGCVSRLHPFFSLTQLVEGCRLWCETLASHLGIIYSLSM
jgi:hypothetical protein